MNIRVNEIDNRYDFEVKGTSFIGNPKDNSIMFITKKMTQHLSKLIDYKNCLIFIDKTVEIPELLREKNCFVLVDNPQYEYGLFMQKTKEKLGDFKYTLTDKGYYVGNNVIIGSNSNISAGAVIGHDVIIGNNCSIGFGSIIKNSTIGDNFYCQNNTCIGEEAFFFAEDGENIIRIPSFGRVIIENNVNIGCNNVIERGFNQDTIIKQGTCIDSNVCVGHDCVIGERVTLTCGVNLAGLVNVGNETYFGMNSSVRQMICIGKKVMVGMGSVVVSNIKDEIKVFGNPAKKMDF